MRPFEPGEKLFLKHTGEEVTVIRLDVKKLVYVDLAGDEIPVYEEDLTYKPPSGFGETDQKEREKTEKEILPEQIVQKPLQESGVSIAFEPVKQNGTVTDFRIWFVNGFFEPLELKFQFFFFNEEHFQLKTKIQSGGVIHLLSIEYDQLNESPSFILKIFGKYNNKILDLNQKIKPQNLFNKEYLEPLLGFMVYRYHVLKEYPQPKSIVSTDPKAEKRIPIDTEKLKQMILDMPFPKDKEEMESPPEVDLHIERIIKNHDVLSNSEIINIQLQHFEKALDRAIMAGLRKFYVIHGVGKGKLRDEVHKLLAVHLQVRSFNNNYHRDYEYGATEVFLR